MTDLLSSEQVKLRALEPSDIERLYKWENDPELWNVSHTSAPFSKYILAMYIKNSDMDIYETKQLRFMIDTQEGETVGAIDLFEFDPFHKRVGVGILIYEKSTRKKGFATEALQLIQNYCFNHLQLHQIWASITEDNEASLNLFSGIGFKECGRKKDWIREGKIFKDEILFQLIQS